MHEDVKLDLARLFFKSSLVIFLISTIAVILFWVCAVLIAAGYLQVSSYDELLYVLRLRLCIP